MATITYNAELRFSNREDRDYWSDLLETSRQAYNECANILDSNGIHLDIKSVHDAVYHVLREDFPSIPSQGVIKIYKDCISAFRSINSNGHIEHSIPTKKNLSMRLDKRLYSRLSNSSISLCSARHGVRTDVSLVRYPKLDEVFSKYPAHDPLIFKRKDRFFLAIPFEVQEVPVQNDTCIGVDLGERRFAITSEGVMFNDREYNARRRQIRYLKRTLQKKGTKNARRHKRKLSRKEQRQSDEMCSKIANAIIASTDAGIIVLEDLSDMKKRTSRDKKGRKKKDHNRRISQVPFYKLLQILSYKALLAGKRVETVSPFMTSQIDCTTGKKNGVRRNRRFYCKNGTVLDSDWNGAVNIARKSKHPFSFMVPLDGALRTWKAGRMSTGQSHLSLPGSSAGALQAAALQGGGS